MANLSGFIIGRAWHFPLSNSRDLVEVCNTSSNVNISMSDSEVRNTASNVNTAMTDSRGWDNVNVVGISKTWRSLQLQNLPVGWHKLVWFPLQVPKFDFYAWLVFKRRLLAIV